MQPPVIYLFVQHTCPEYPLIVPNSLIFRYIQQHGRGPRAHWQHLYLGRRSCHHITALQTKVTRGSLSLIRIEDHKEQICRLGRRAWLVSVCSMVQCVPTAGRCWKILFLIVTRSLACFCRVLGCFVRRLTTLGISAFTCSCPKLQYAWDSFWQFPLAAHCAACT